MPRERPARPTKQRASCSWALALLLKPCRLLYCAGMTHVVAWPLPCETGMRCGLCMLNAPTCPICALKGASPDMDSTPHTKPTHGAAVSSGNPLIDAPQPFLQWGRHSDNRATGVRGTRPPPPLPTRKTAVQRLDGDADIPSARLWQMLQKQEAEQAGDTEGLTAEKGTDTAEALQREAEKCIESRTEARSGTAEATASGTAIKSRTVPTAASATSASGMAAGSMPVEAAGIGHFAVFWS